MLSYSLFFGKFFGYGSTKKVDRDTAALGADAKLNKISARS